MNNSLIMRGDKLEQYRLYKYLENGWEKTSYIGDKVLMFKILKSLSNSKIYLFDVRKER